MSSNIQSTTAQNKSVGFVQHNDIINKISSSKYIVYHGHNNNLNQEVAIKVFPSSSDSTPNVNYLNEKKNLAGLDHPNIIKVFETVDESLAVLDRKEQQVSYISFEMASNGDLFDVISKHGPMSEELTRTLFHDLLNATEYIHSTGIAHLDMKLENVLLDNDFNLKVIDFDLSQPLDAKTLMAKGTLGYRAPEIKNGFCHNLRAADIYSLGVILFIMFGGNPPYAEVNRGMGHEFDAFYKLLRKNNSRFWDIHSQYKGAHGSYFSEDFKDLVNLMLTEEPRQRASIEEIKSSKWFQGPVLDKENYQKQMREYMQKTH